MKNSLSFILSLFLGTILCVPASAEIKVIEAESTYVMGDNDSRVDARRIATREAQRKALELAGTFVSSLTQVREYRLTRDEVTAYTAGIVETEVIADESRGTLDHPEIFIRARCTVDTEILATQIDRYRENQELRDQLTASAKEQNELRKERDELRTQLSAEKDKEKAEETRKRLDAVLTREEGAADTSRVWAKLSPRLDLYGGKESRQDIPPGDIDRSRTVLQRAVKADPRNNQARLLLAAVYQQSGDIAAAEKELRAALERSPNDALLHMRLGILLREQGRNREALKEFHIIEQKRPHQPQMLFQTALSHKAIGDCRLASAYMKRLLLYSKKNDRPDIAKLKPRARAVIEECGGQPAPKMNIRRRTK